MPGRDNSPEGDIIQCGLVHRWKHRVIARSFLSRGTSTFDELDLILLDRTVIVETARLGSFRSYYNQVETIVAFLPNEKMCLRIIHFTSPLN
jgi:hypothetical protein